MTLGGLPRPSDCTRLVMGERVVVGDARVAHDVIHPFGAVFIIGIYKPFRPLPPNRIGSRYGKDANGFSYRKSTIWAGWCLSGDLLATFGTFS